LNIPYNQLVCDTFKFDNAEYEFPNVFDESKVGIVKFCR